MVYKHLDPARDWDAWCDDHPEPPEPEEVRSIYWICKCRADHCLSEWTGTDADDVNEVYCEECGGHAEVIGVDLQLLADDLQADKEEAELDRYLSQMEDDDYFGRRGRW